MGKKKISTVLSSLSVVLPAFNDAKSLPSIMAKIVKFLPKLVNRYEIIIVNDGSKDDTGEVLERLKRLTPFLRIINHRKNLGYGAALVSGFKNARYDYIFYTDSDGQYDISELKNLVVACDSKTDLVTGFKIKRSDSFLRKSVGALYNQFVRIVFNLKVRDVDCDFRLFRRKILKGIVFKITSGAFDVEFIKNLEEKNICFKEVGVHHYPRSYGRSQFFRLGNIIKSLGDLFLLRFS